MSDVQSFSDLRQKTQKDLFKKANVVGVGVGYKEVKGAKTSDLALKVLVQDKVPPSALSAKDAVPAKVDGMVTDVLAVGKVTAFQNHKARHRPAMPGISIGHYAITAGTFGAVVRDAQSNQRLILSNNHVLANSNSADKGDSILQPGRADGGKDPQDRIADLERFVRIRFIGEDDNGGSKCPIARFFSSLLNTLSAITGSKTRLVPISGQDVPNLVDAAVAKPVNDDIISDEILEIGVVQGTAEAVLGLKVRKSGRTTGYTEGEVNALDASIKVGYGNQTALFEQQILTNDMSDPGDSGSLIVDEQNHAVGLLFAGSTTVTVINPISAVLSALNITI